MSFHSNASLGARHPVHNYEYADATARTAASGFTASDVGKVAQQLDDESFWVLKNHSPITWAQIDGGGAGEANTGSNVGTGQGNIFRDKTGTTLNFKKLQQSGAITITDNPDEIVIATTGAVGEANTASNVGTAGVGVFKQKTGVDLEFKNINAGSSKITINDDTGNDEVDIDVAETNVDHNALSNLAVGDVHTQYVLRSILTANGDLFTRIAGVIARLGIGAEGQVLTAQGGLPVWAPSTGFDMRDVIVFDHFQSSNDDNDEHGWMGWREFGSGIGSSISYTGVAGHPGVLQVQCGTGSNARRALGLGDSSSVGGRVVVGGTNPIVCEMLLRFPAAADINSANLLQGMYGLGLDWQGDTEIENGVYLRLQPGTSSNWFLVCANGGTRSTSDLGVGPTAGTWQRLGFTATATSVQAQINGSNVGSAITTNIPTTGVGFGLKARSNNGDGSTTQIDYVLLTQVTDKEGS